MQKKFQNKIGNSILLLDKTGFVVIEDDAKKGTANLSIWNSDGTIRFKPEIPINPKENYQFYYAEYVGSKLHLILAGVGRDFGVYIDEKRGTLFGLHEAR